MAVGSRFGVPRGNDGMVEEEEGRLREGFTVSSAPQAGRRMTDPSMQQQHNAGQE